MTREEAIKEAYGIPVTKAQHEALQFLIPELAESEDERIRENLHNFFLNAKLRKQNLGVGVSNEKILTYLEKQKEQVSAQTETEKQYVRTLKALVSDFIRDRNPEDVPYYQGIFDWLEGRHIEQKPAEWSDEDEAMLKEIISFFKDGSVKLQHDLDLYTGFLEKRLKSLRPQPHTVSIKDATKFGNLEYERGVKDGIQHSENHHWKPSDEQMDALKNSAYGTYQNGDGPALRELYNDLKKLM